MKKFLTNIKKEAEHIKLSHAEKAAMRAAIFGAPSPVHVRQSPYVFASLFSYNVRMVMAGLVALVVVGGGTASAAQGSLPGDALYGIKVSVNERVELALAQDTASKATLEVELAQRRVEEAQSLAVAGRLDAATAEKLAITVETHAQNAETLADEVEASEPGVAAEVRTKLASSFSANGAVLKKLGSGSSNQRNKEESETLSSKVIARSEAPRVAVAMQARSFATMAPAPKTAPTQDSAAGMATLSIASSESAPQAEQGNPKAAARLQKKATEAIADAQQEFKEVGELDADTAAKVQASLAAAAESMSMGSVAFGLQAYAEASAHFTDALRTALRLEALLKAQKKFDNGIIQTLIGGEVQGAAIEPDPTDVVAPSPAITPEPVQIDLGL